MCRSKKCQKNQLVSKAQNFLISNVISLKSGYNHSLVLLKTGRVLSFGFGYNGELGNGISGNVDENFYYSNIPVEVSNNSGYDGTNCISVCSGYNFSLILLNSGKVLSFGSNQNGKLGNGIDQDIISSIPVEVSKKYGYNGNNCVSISAGFEHSLILLNNGKVLAFGDDYYGQLGNQQNGNEDEGFMFSSPVEVKAENGYNSKNCISISAGSYHSLILLNNGKVLAFGGGNSGQLGNGRSGDNYFSSIPVEISKESGYNGNNCVSISAGNASSLILLDNGKVLSFGYGFYGQLGNGISGDVDGNEYFSSIPVEINYGLGYNGNNCVSISANDNLCLILLDTGKVLSFGYGGNGELGNAIDGEGYVSSIPVEVQYENGYDGTNCISVSAGGEFSSILLNNGKFLTFGQNIYGQLGNNDSEDSNIPVSVSITDKYNQENGLIKPNTVIQKFNTFFNSGKMHTLKTKNQLSDYQRKLFGKRYEYTLPLQNSLLRISKTKIV